jgi:nitroreductase
MDFTTVIKTRRSVRAYADKPIPEDVLGRVLEAGRLAPSACNFQPWRFIVVKDAATRGQIAKMAGQQQFVAKAPVVIVCCGKRYAQKYNWIGENLYLVDLGIAVEHLALAARNEGLGTCWIGSFQDQPIKKLLGVPADHDVVMLLPMGYPVSADQFSATTERLGIEQVVFAEKFGGPGAGRASC